METLIGVAIGGVLGFAGAVGLDWFRKRAQRAEMTSCMHVELKGLQVKVAACVSLLRNQLGNADKPMYNWLRESILPYDGPDISPEFKSALERMSNADIDSASIGAYANHSHREGHSRSLKKFTLPFITANLPLIPVLGAGLQMHIFSILGKLDVINQQVDVYWRDFEKTFDETAAENKDAIEYNLTQSYRTIVEQGKHLVDMITNVLPMLKCK